MPRWPRSPGRAGTCPWRSACSPANCAITPPGPRRPGRGLSSGQGPAGPDACGEPVGRRCVRPVLRRPHSRPQQLFRRLAWPGPEPGRLRGCRARGHKPGQARRHLDELYDQHLIAEPARPLPVARPAPRACPRPGRERSRGVCRRDRAAAGLLPAYRRRPPAASIAPWGHPAAGRSVRSLAIDHPWAPDLSTPQRAAAWLEAEHPSLRAAADHAAAVAMPSYAIAIAAETSAFLRRRGHWDQSWAMNQTALTAARQAGDRPGEADALAQLGILRLLTGDYPAAATSLASALRLYQRPRRT